MFLKKHPVSNREIILVLAASALGDPKHDCGEYQGRVLRDVGVAVVLVLVQISGENVLEYLQGLLGGQILHKEGVMMTMDIRRYPPTRPP